MNPVNYGMSWNKARFRELGVIIGLEARALWVAGAVEEGPRNHIGLDHWSRELKFFRLPGGGPRRSLLIRQLEDSAYLSHSPPLPRAPSSQPTLILRRIRGGGARVRSQARIP